MTSSLNKSAIELIAYIIHVGQSYSSSYGSLDPQLWQILGAY